MSMFDPMLIIYMLPSVFIGLMLSESDNLRCPRWAAALGTAAVYCVYNILFWPVWNETLLLRTFLFPAILLIIVWNIIDDRPGRKLFLAVVNYVIMMISDSAATLVSMGILGMTFDEYAQVAQMDTSRLIASASVAIYLMAMSNIFMSFYNRVERKVRRRTILLTVLLFCSQFLLFSGLMISQVELEANVVIVMATLCVGFSGAVQYAVFRTVNASAAALRDRLELEQEKLQKEMDEKYLRLAEAQEAELSAFRHDFRNQLQVIYSLMEEEPEKAALLLKELEDKMSRQSTEKEGDLK